MKVAQEAIDRTLIIRFSSIGDIVLSSLLLRAFLQKFPQSRIDYIVKSEYADLVRHNPNVSHVVEFPSDATFKDLLRLRRIIKSSDYDVIIDIHDSIRSRILCFGTGRTVRIRKRKIARFFLVKFKWNIYSLFGEVPSVAERYIETVSQFGVVNDGKGLELFFPDAARQKASELLSEVDGDKHRPIIGVCPSAKHNNKMWPWERFAETGSSLALQRNATIVLFGSREDRTLCEDIECKIKTNAPNAQVINLAGVTSLVEAAAVMDRCAIVISNDSGLMHIADALKKKVVAIFGPTVREFGFFPYGTTNVVVERPTLDCRPCTHLGLAKCPKGHFKCMNEITPHQVLERALQLLET